LSAKLTKTHSFRLFFWLFCPLGLQRMGDKKNNSQSLHNSEFMIIIILYYIILICIIFCAHTT